MMRSDHNIPSKITFPITFFDLSTSNNLEIILYKQPLKERGVDPPMLED